VNVRPLLGETALSSSSKDLAEFEEAAQPKFWQWSARDLICAANILRSQCNRPASISPIPEDLWKPHNGMRLLYGLALENLLKGLLIANGVKPILSGKLNPQLKTHNLVDLWRRARLPLDQNTNRILKILRWSVEVDKYPVGTKPDPDVPSAFWLAEMRNIEAVGRLLSAVEDALRVKEPVHSFEKADLLKLCSE
jgi:hypothetical protein